MSRFKGPLAGSYPSAVALVLLALTPYLVLSTATFPLSAIVAKGVGLSQPGLELTTGMANAAYAFGTVAAVQLALHKCGRRLLVLYALLFTVGSVLAAMATAPALFVVGRIMQGLFTSMMLIAAVPPLVIGWPASRMPWTAATMNMGIFGAVALGPVVGGAQAASGSFRLLFWIVAAVGLLAFLFTLLTYEDQPPLDTSAPWDWVAQVLAGVGCAAAFFGASQLQSHAFTNPIVLIPLLAGLGGVVVLVAYEYRVRNPLMPMRSLATTFPLAGVIIAICAGASSVAIVELTQLGAQSRNSPLHLGMLFWPEFGAALVTAVLFGLAFRTRFVPAIAFGGMVMLAGGAAILTGVATGSNALIPIGAGVVGLGVGGSVSPALFTAGLSLKSRNLPRVFALIELLRGVAAFIAGPLLLHMAKTVGGSPARGVSSALWVCFGIAAFGAFAAAALFVLGRARLQPPDLEGWLEGERPAIESPALAAGLRRRRVGAAAGS